MRDQACTSGWRGVIHPIVGIMPQMNERQLSPLDRLLSGLDSAFRAAAASPTRASRPSPAADLPETPLSAGEKSHSAALMRVNHAGEIAAQGLYQGHAAVARDPEIEMQMKTSSVSGAPSLTKNSIIWEGARNGLTNWVRARATCVRSGLPARG